MYFDIEDEICKAQALSEPMLDELFEANELICERIDSDFPDQNIDFLQAAISRCERAETLLTKLKEQLQYMHKCELEFVRDCNAANSGDPYEEECLQKFHRGIA